MQGVLTDGDIRRGLSKGVDFAASCLRADDEVSENYYRRQAGSTGSASYGKQQAETGLQYCLLLTKTIRLSACCI